MSFKIDGFLSKDALLKEFFKLCKDLNRYSYVILDELDLPKNEPDMQDNSRFEL